MLPMQTLHFCQRFLLIPALLGFLFCSSPALAWNAAGHRLCAQIAWETLDETSRQHIDTWLSAHPDATTWQRRGRSNHPATLFIEASTWADEIRQDPRFYPADQPTLTEDPRLSDWGKHKDWHYLDVDQRGQVVEGQLHYALQHLSTVLRSTPHSNEITWALPWLIHLVADLHQPLHVGRHTDQGGNTIEVETPFVSGRPFTNLHRYWDELPGPPWLRGEKLRESAQRLMETYPAPPKGNLLSWQNESHALLKEVYPDEVGSLLPLISESFHQRAKTLAEARITAAGYRLGWLLQQLIQQRVSRETRP